MQSCRVALAPLLPLSQCSACAPLCRISCGQPHSDRPPTPRPGHAAADAAHWRLCLLEHAYVCLMQCHCCPPHRHPLIKGPLRHSSASLSPDVRANSPCRPFSFGNGDLATALFFCKRPDVDRGASGSLSYCRASASHRLEPLGEDLGVRPPLALRRPSQGCGRVRART
jgi:hypothetical protein